MSGAAIKLGGERRQRGEVVDLGQLWFPSQARCAVRRPAMDCPHPDAPTKSTAGLISAGLLPRPVVAPEKDAAKRERKRAEDPERKRRRNEVDGQDRICLRR